MHTVYFGSTSRRYHDMYLAPLAIFGSSKRPQMSGIVKLSESALNQFFEVIANLIASVKRFISILNVINGVSHPCTADHFEREHWQVHARPHVCAMSPRRQKPHRPLDAAQVEAGILVLVDSSAHLFTVQHAAVRYTVCIYSIIWLML